MDESGKNWNRSELKLFRKKYKKTWKTREKRD
jgi:hypothetical protein